MWDSALENAESEVILRGTWCYWGACSRKCKGLNQGAELTQEVQGLNTKVK